MNYYDEIKNILIDNEVYKRVKDYSKNKHELENYYKIGKLLIEAQGGEERAKYGDGLIKEYSRKLSKELGKGYTISSLKRMRSFFLIIEKGAAMPHLLTWSHFIELLVLKNINEINYYIDVAVKQNLSYRKLREKIKSNEYERLDESTRNKLISNEILDISDNIKHPIIIKNKYKTDEISEKMLKGLILEDMDSFLHELGEGFTYVGNEYKIKLGNSYNYIDILLFNYKYNCFVVVELKVTELKKEHIGQIHTYMNYIDKNVKNIYQDKTIGIIIVRKDNQFIMEYCSDERIYRTTYEFM